MNQCSEIVSPLRRREANQIRELYEPLTHVNRSKTVATGHPEIITENFDDDVSNYFSLIKWTVLPPCGLLHPVLPYRTQGKLMFALCMVCADTGNQTPCTHSDAERAICGACGSVEVMKALEKGYRILQMHEVWHFPKKTDILFKNRPKPSVTSWTYSP